MSKDEKYESLKSQIKAETTEEYERKIREIVKKLNI